MALPFGAAMSLAILFPVLFVYAIPSGFVGTCILLVWQLAVKQWIVFRYNQLLFHVDPVPLGSASSDYWQWPTINQVFFQGDGPEEHFDPLTGWTIGVLRLGLKGLRHPEYNNRQRIRELIFHYEGKWKDNVKYGLPGTAGIERKGAYDGAVVDINNQAFITVTEWTSEAVPDPSGKSEEERMRQIPSYRTDPVDHIDKWIPHLIIKRGDATIEEELKDVQ